MSTPEIAATSPMRRFDPVKVAHLEKENWMAYYRKQWPRLMVVSISMVQEAFGLSMLRAPYGAYLVARAEMAAAPINNDIPVAERYMRRFYDMVKDIHKESYDVDEAARLEVNWWVVHRKLFGQDDKEPLVQALTELYAATYCVPAQSVREAAYHRAQAMVYSDKWVYEGCPDHETLLQQEQDELIASYKALRQAVA